MSLIYFRHVHPVNGVVILDRDGDLSRFGQFTGVFLCTLVAIQLTDLYLCAAV